MEKLIELLNEYSIIIDDRITGEYNTPLHIWGGGELEYNVSIWRIISKKFGFIKRLVDNDKIDLDKVENKFYNEICITDYGDKNRACSKSNLVISVLSISDAPLNDLFQLLK